MAERLLINFFYAHPVGHAVEALHYAQGHWAADPSREVSLVLNRATAWELAELCPFVTAVHPVGGAADLASVPRDWDWVLDDFRRAQPFQLEAFPWMREYYEASDEHLRAARGRALIYADPPGYRRRQPLRLRLPERAVLAGGDATRWIALMPAGSSERSLYPSTRSWLRIMDAIRAARPDVRFVLVGKRRADDRTSTALDDGEHAALLAHPSRPVDGFDRPLLEQLALVEACDVFLSPHTGFGLAALAVATPWLTLSGGRWFEYYFNEVPFRSIIPDTERYPAFSQFEPALTIADDDGPRTPSMSAARIRDDLDAIVAGACELLDGTLTYERALTEYYTSLLRAHGDDGSQIWSIDGVHLDHVPAR